MTPHLDMDYESDDEMDVLIDAIEYIKGNNLFKEVYYE